MHKARLLAVAAGTFGVFLLALAGNGQEKLGLAGVGDSLRMALLRTAEVQKELKLKPEQIQKLERLREEAKESKKSVESAHGKGKEKGKPKAVDPVAKEQERLLREAMNADLAQLEQETDRQIRKILEADQGARLTQIALRVEGPSAFLTPELMAALSLGAEQLQAIREILDDMKGQRDELKESQRALRH